MKIYVISRSTYIKLFELLQRYPIQQLIITDSPKPEQSQDRNPTDLRIMIRSVKSTWLQTLRRKLAKMNKDYQTKENPPILA